MGNNKLLKVLILSFFVSCNSSNSDGESLIEIKTQVVEKKWSYTIPITNNGSFSSDLTYDLTGNSDLVNILPKITKVDIGSINILIKNFTGETGIVEINLDRPSELLSSMTISNIVDSIGKTNSFIITDAQKSSLSSEIISSKALSLIANGTLKNISPLPSVISFEIVLFFTLTYET
tara:strand:- start:710 stop:1240 length:531 start_codon:yes stop_codon:yes gene_type:complete